MYEYRAPRRDFEFVLHEVLGAERALAGLGRADVNRELIDGILDEAARFAEQVLSPLNWQGDWQPPEWVDGRVRTPEAFRAAYRQFREGGWCGMHADPAYGGQGLPAIAHIAVGEMLCSAAMAWRMASGLSEGAVQALARHGSEPLKATYLRALATGEWTGTMCLTEPQSGTDLGLLRTRAEPGPDGAYAITGTKIFISWGEHDLTDNIVHLVLARLPDAAPGTRGLSLFLVPKRLDGADNGVRCQSIEHKMGIHGSPTCVMSFEGARGFLVGTPGGGLACMFTMMNHARLGVGLQGLGLSERALQASVAYAFERRQGRAARGAADRAQPADRIVEHADVRRMLLTIKALTEGQRLLCYHTYLLLDVAELAPDPAERVRAGQLVAVLVPIVKAFLTDSAMETTALAVQLHGGAGFIRETGVEQWLRDAKITCIYEGTNGIQALDLLGRKVLADGGAALGLLGEEIRRTLALEMPPALRAGAAPLAELLDELGTLARLVAERAAANADELGAAASDFLALAGHVCTGWAWLRMALVAEQRLAAGSAEREFYEGKRFAALHYFERLLPRARAHAAAARAGVGSVPALRAEHFGA